MRNNKSKNWFLAGAMAIFFMCFMQTAEGYYR